MPSNIVTTNIDGAGKVEIAVDGGPYLEVVSGQQTSVETGKDIALRATPNEGYKFVQWSGASTETNPEIVVNITEDKTFTATFAEDIVTYTLATSVTGSGTITPSSGTFQEGQSVTLVAEPIHGYQFVSWGGDASGTNKEVDIVMDANKTVTATFEPITYNLTVVQPVNGTISPTGGTYNLGESVELTAEPADGFTFGYWTIDASGHTSPMSITMNANMTVSAVFLETVPNKHRIITLEVPQGYVELSPDKDLYDEGETVRIEAIPNKPEPYLESDYEFDRWEGLPAGIPNTNPVDIAITEDLRLTPVFKLKATQFRIYPSVVGDGAIEIYNMADPEPRNPVPENTLFNLGDNLMLKAIPDASRQFFFWSGDIELADYTVTEFEFTISTDLSIAAIFSDEPGEDLDPKTATYFGKNHKFYTYDKNTQGDYVSPTPKMEITEDGKIELKKVDNYPYTILGQVSMVKDRTISSHLSKNDLTFYHTEEQTSVNPSGNPTSDVKGEIRNRINISNETGEILVKKYQKQSGTLQNLPQYEDDYKTVISAENVNTPAVTFPEEKGDRTVMYHRTKSTGTPDHEGFRVRWEQHFADETNNDVLVFEKTDDNPNVVDGGMAFVNSNGSGAKENSNVHWWKWKCIHWFRKRCTR